jgi:hypothetical protein
LKTVYLHIGLGRCGTTSIQRVLFENQQKLKEAGYLYIKTDPGGQAHHTLCPLKKELLPGAKEAWDNIAKEFIAMREENLMISSENMIGIADELIKHIAELFKECRVKILFIGRHQSGLLPSTFSQWTKAGILFESFSSFFKATNQLWHFQNILDRWGKYFFREDIHCRILRSGEDAVETFATFLPSGKIKNLLVRSIKHRLNGSISSELIRLIFLYDISYSLKLPVWDTFPGWELIEPAVEDVFNAKRNNFIQEIERVSSVIYSPCENLLTADEIKMIYDTYLETNHSFHMKYMSHQPSDWIRNYLK